MQNLKTALAQMKVIPGMPQQNLKTMLRFIEQAKAANVDLIVFPEMCLGGYLVGDKWLDDSFCNDLMEYNEQLKAASHGIAIAYGNVHVVPQNDKRIVNRDGRKRKYNAVYVFQNGEPAKRIRHSQVLPEGVQPKTLLPNYRIFDDARYFFSTQDIALESGVALKDILQPFLITVNGKDIPVGFELCEDLWCEDYRENGKSINPTKMLIDNGAQLIVNSSASPWTIGKHGARDRRVEFLKKDSGDLFTSFLYVNCVGAQNNGKNIVTFDGGSTVYDENGMPVQFVKTPYSEELLIVEQQNKTLLTRDEKPAIAQKLDALIAGIKYVRDIIGSEKEPQYVIGLSGGVDSAVVASLLVIALGPKSVTGINMPTQYNSAETRSSAEKLARALGIKYAVVPIEEIVQKNIELLSKDIDGSGRELSLLAEENIQAKIRGASILSNFAGKYGALFTNNGNKLETALGYATLYGDVGGSIAPIGDLNKAEVFALAKYLNDEVFKQEVIPLELLPDELFNFGKGTIAPTAELKAQQIDPMRFGYHDALLSAFTDYNKKSPCDVFLWYIDGTMEENLGVSKKLLERWQITDPKTFVEDLEWFASSIQRNVFKRVQSPPIIITSKSSFGFDIRESMLPFRITQEYERLRKRVLKMQTYVSKK